MKVNNYYSQVNLNDVKIAICKLKCKAGIVLFSMEVYFYLPF